MNAREIIERIDRLNEAPVEEPEIDPGIAEPDVEPSAPPAPSRPRPGREPRPGPFTVPPDYTPGTFPHPKSGDDGEEIEAWLEATQQPVQDWEWDGENLRLLLDDGTIETYTRQQLDEIGVFGSMAFAEALEIPPFGGAKSGYFNTDEVEQAGNDFLAAGGEGGLEDMGGEAEPSEGEFGDLGGPGEPGLAGEEGEPDDTILQGILGGASTAEPIEVTGEPAEQLGQAVSDVVAAILGIIQQTGGSEAETGGESEPKSDSEKSDKKPKAKKDGDKKDDKKKDKEDDKESDE